MKIIKYWFTLLDYEHLVSRLLYYLINTSLLNCSGSGTRSLVTNKTKKVCNVHFTVNMRGNVELKMGIEKKGDNKKENIIKRRKNR